MTTNTLFQTLILLQAFVVTGAAAQAQEFPALFKRQAVGTNSSTCFDCRNTGCTNFGVCGSNAACSCNAGWGGQDCAKPLCGSLAQFNSSRSISTLASPCACEDGWSGPNCNVCESTKACGFLPTSTLGSRNICNKSPVVWGFRHFSYCNVSNVLLKAAYNLPSSVTVERNSQVGSILATMWLANTPQFSCTGQKCSQTFNANQTQTTWKCSDIKCICQPGTLMCGGSPVDISGVVNSANGLMGVTCSDPQTCNLDLDFIKGIFPNGINLMNCDHGECVDEFATPSSADVSTPGIDSFGIVIITVLGSLIVIGEAFIIWGLVDRRKKRALPVPLDAPGLPVSFDKISYSVGGVMKRKEILSEISGIVSPGELLAIMGPSGSGKTTFLDILARKRKGGTVKGEVYLNGDEIADDSTFKRLSGYVDQEDIHLACLTVRETLEFSASLRLPESVTAAQKAARVDEVLRQLGLTHVANSRVGDSLNRGISGGEKKRLSIAAELVTNPSVLFVDEPTSGLDSYNALQVIQTLSNLAHEHKKTVIFTVHQPNSTIFALFTKVLLLSKGKSIYFGPAQAAAAYCEQMGHPCPPSYHIADHLLDVASASTIPAAVSSSVSIIQVDGLRHRSSAVSDTSVNDDSISKDGTDKHPELVGKQSILSFADPHQHYHGASVITQIQKVLGRSWKVFFRNPVLFLSHLILSILLGFFIGSLYYHVDDSLAGLQNRLGSIFFIQALLAFAGLSAISSLSEDRVLFIRERSNGFYGSFPYFLSKIVFDLLPLRVIPALCLSLISYYLIGLDSGSSNVFKYTIIMVVFSMNAGLHGFFIACMVPQTSTSTLAAVMSILFQMLFSGILVNQVNIPAALNWIQYISFFKYAYEACIATEAGSMTIKSKIAGVDVQIPAATVLTSFGLDATAYYRDLGVTLGLFLGFLILIALLMNFRLRERK
ncbi:hypothetical protein HDU91_006612 [Kappamyces sp. JEL0680]|nr:hypothetical protein HDU91_006612 [Kappamyces sp. JEL0680]